MLLFCSTQPHRPTTPHQTGDGRLIEASSTLPALHDHLKQTREIEGKVGAKNSYSLQRDTNISRRYLLKFAELRLVSTGEDYRVNQSSVGGRIANFAASCTLNPEMPA